MPATIRPVTIADAAAIADIYNPYIDDTIITFETVRVDAAEIARRIADTTVSYPYLVAELGGDVVAYAYGTRWRARAAYGQTAETAIYVKRGLHGVGVGKPLYLALLEQLRARDVHIAIGGISLPNAASVVFHERCGYAKVAHFSEVGRKFDRWVDVGFWQRGL